VYDPVTAANATGKRRVTLSFDNGPEPEITDQVLDCLAHHNIRATFFVLGYKLAKQQGQALAREARAQGHWIGNHTFTHSIPLGELAADKALAEIEQTKQLLNWLEQPQRLFRPFGGGGRIGRHLLQPAVVDKLTRERYTCVLWNSVPGDWRDPDGWMKTALGDCQTLDWPLVVLHDLPTGAMRHLEQFIARLKEENFEFIQAFPPDCLPIVDGEIVLPLDDYVRN
jgi:peptidoglycan/xylan/chitin deacetylase (PgdA/CDA1 family)